jgi:hypothetical protein
MPMVLALMPVSLMLVELFVPCHGDIMPWLW